ncbi:HMA2 domain-containing protein [Rhodoblastus sp.]|uniref:HMA2 domain-containing protein n=1 Tax=Rhodoblastus sp. TaxID=1962975 RepID=UPI003F9E6261
MSSTNGKDAADLPLAPAAKKSPARHKLHVAHHTPGRVRMKIPSAKGDPEALRVIAQSFVGVAGVESVSVNATTGSLLLKYNPDRPMDVHQHVEERAGGYSPLDSEIDEVTEFIEKEAEFLAQHSHTAKVIVDFFTRFDQAIKKHTNNYVDLKILLAAGLIVGTIAGVGLHTATPVWLVLVVFSINHMVQLHQHQTMHEANRAVLAGAAA